MQIVQHRVRVNNKIKRPLSQPRGEILLLKLWLILLLLLLFLLCLTSALCLSASNSVGLTSALSLGSSWHPLLTTFTTTIGQTFCGAVRPVLLPLQLLAIGMASRPVDELPPPPPPPPTPASPLAVIVPFPTSVPVVPERLLLSDSSFAISVDEPEAGVTVADVFLVLVAASNVPDSMSLPPGRAILWPHKNGDSEGGVDIGGYITDNFKAFT